MTHRANPPRTEAQKTMLALIIKSDSFAKADQIASEFDQNVNSVRAYLSKFKNELRILDHDSGGYYRLAPGRELEAWGFVYYGMDAFESKLRGSAAEALLERPEIRAYFNLPESDTSTTELDRRLSEFR